MKRFFLLTLLCVVTVFAYSQDIIYVYKDNVSGLYGLRTRSTVVTKGIYDNIQPLSDNTFVFEKKGKKGVIADNGKVLIKPAFLDINNFGYDSYLVNDDGRWGVINRYEKPIIPIQFSGFKQLSSYLYEVTQDGKKGLASILGYLVVDPTYNEVQMLSDYMFVLKDKQTIYVVDNLGKPILAGDYDSLEKLESTDFFQVTKGGKKGLIDIDGTAILDAVYDSIDTSDPYYILLNQGDKLGFLINKKCIPAIFDRIVYVQNNLGVIAVKQGNMTGFVTFGGDVIESVYENLSRFAASGYAFAERNGKLICVDTTGKEKEVHEAIGRRKY